MVIAPCLAEAEQFVVGWLTIRFQLAIDIFVDLAVVAAEHVAEEDQL